MIDNQPIVNKWWRKIQEQLVAFFKPMVDFVDFSDNHFCQHGF